MGIVWLERVEKFGPLGTISLAVMCRACLFIVIPRLTFLLDVQHIT